MRNSSFIALPLWPKQLVIVCGHVGLPAFGREQGIFQSHVQVQPVSRWKEFPPSQFPQIWQKQRHHSPSQGMGSFEAEFRHSVLWTICSAFLLATFCSSSLQGAKVSLPSSISAWGSLSASVPPEAQWSAFSVRHWRAPLAVWGGMNNLVGVTKGCISVGSWVASIKTPP